ncbi:hypothetical protein SeMB42_g02604 [Synchytrium endobioticum]|uniref:G-patch domain-containing protein n=1 Tax=Synchytrium endobioticum TaxID=286115 RepID=A0A507DCZ4_9FUNG|nr:hypothetical protein SeMB42_g02604 [Synchytrium endobioticum]
MSRPGLGSTPDQDPASEDEDDYMSAAILASASTAHPQQPPQTYSQRRAAALAKQQASHLKPLRVREQEARQEAFDTRIDATNVGFRMLSRLGYREGMGLGRQPGAIVEPIPIVLKNDRLGIGIRTTSNKRHSSAAGERDEEDSIHLKTREEYRSAMNSRFQMRHVAELVQKARRACESLDTGVGSERNKYWMPLPVASDEEMSSQTKLFDVIGSSQEEYSHEAFDEGGRKKASKDDGANAQEENVVNDFDVLEPPQQLQDITEYLRDTHHYCIYCGTKYNDRLDLGSSCPGNKEELHDEL